jgi:hypothetical protein
MPKSTFQSVLGIAVESTYGTPATAVTYLPVNGAPKPNDKQKMDPDKGLRGSMGVDYGLQLGVYDTEYDFDGNIFVDTIGYPLAGILGDVAYTGGTNSGTATTTTAQLIAGGTPQSVAVASATGIVPGTVLAVDTGALLELVTVASVSGLNVTMTRFFRKDHASGVAVQPVVAPFTTTFALLNSGVGPASVGQGQPPSYTLTDWYGVNGRQYPGAVFSECNIKLVADGLLTFTAKSLAQPSVSLAGVKPVATYSTIKPLSGFSGAITFGSPLTSPDNLTVMTANIDIKRKVDSVHTIDGTAGPYAIFGGGLSVTGKMTVVMESDAQLTAYLNNSQPSLNINYTPAAGQQLQFNLNNVGYTAVVVGRSKDYVEADITYTGIFNATNAGASGGYSPIKVTLQNAVAPGLYR